MFGGTNNFKRDFKTNEKYLPNNNIISATDCEWLCKVFEIRSK